MLSTFFLNENPRIPGYPVPASRGSSRDNSPDCWRRQRAIAGGAKELTGYPAAIGMSLTKSYRESEYESMSAVLRGIPQVYFHRASSRNW